MSKFSRRLLMILSIALLTPSLAFAAIDANSTGLAAAGQAAGFTSFCSGSASSCFAGFVGKSINVLLSFVGIVLLLYVLYAGFLWMTAGGDGKKVGEAKTTIFNAVVGLIILTSAFSISNFVLSKLGGSLGNSGGSSSTNSTNSSNSTGSTTVSATYLPDGSGNWTALGANQVVVADIGTPGSSAPSSFTASCSVAIVACLTGHHETASNTSLDVDMCANASGATVASAAGGSYDFYDGSYSSCPCAAGSAGCGVSSPTGSGTGAGAGVSFSADATTGDYSSSASGAPAAVSAFITSSGLTPGCSNAIVSCLETTPETVSNPGADVESCAMSPDVGVTGVIPAGGVPLRYDYSHADFSDCPAP